MDERAFLNAITSNPNDDAVLLIYADWLDEQNDPMATAKATFLRLTTQLPRHIKVYNRNPIGKQLVTLAADLDTTWLAQVSRLHVEHCGKTRQQPRARRPLPVLTFDFLCERRWEDMQTTADPTVRHCDDCEQAVHYCGTIIEARDHAEEGHCIAVDIALPRRRNDVTGVRVRRMGRMLPAAYQREVERRNRLDPVSEARERRKPADNEE